MTPIEIAIIIVVALFAIVVVLIMLGFDIKKFFKWLFSGNSKKSKKDDKPKKEKKTKFQKEKTNNDSNKLEDKNKKIEKMDKDGTFKPQEEPSKIDDGEEKVKTKSTENKEKAFQITKKGVVRINKKAIERDSRTGAVIEQAIKPGQKIEELNDSRSQKGFDDFDALLEKLKDIGDPDDLDDDTFKNLFMPSNLDKLGEMSDEELDRILGNKDDFESLESSAEGKIDRRLKHYTIDGSHLRLGKKYDDYPSRMPTLDMDHFVFTDRLTGRYDNIKMGDVSNILKPSEEEIKAAETQSKSTEESDEEIFAKIMERRRRELGLDSTNNKNNIDELKSEISLRDLVIADAIMNPVSKRNIKKTIN